MEPLWAGMTATLGPALLPGACAMVLLGWGYPPARLGPRLPLALGIALGYGLTALLGPKVPLTPISLRIAGGLGTVLWAVLLVTWSRGSRDAPAPLWALALGAAVGLLLRLGEPAYAGPHLALLRQDGAAGPLLVYALGTGLGLAVVVILAGFGRKLPKAGGLLGALGVGGLLMGPLLLLAGFYPRLVEILLLYLPSMSLG